MTLEYAYSSLPSFILVMPQLQSFGASPIGYAGHKECEGSAELRVERSENESEKTKWIEIAISRDGRESECRVSMITDRTQRTNSLGFCTFG